MRTCTVVLALVLSIALADYAEIGIGGTLTTNRPFCGS